MKPVYDSWHKPSKDEIKSMKKLVDWVALRKVIEANIERMEKDERGDDDEGRKSR